MVEEKIEETLARLAELETEMRASMARARGLLHQAGEEIARLRVEKAQARLTVYTEAEAARELQIGESTLRRLRTSHPGTWPCFRAGDLVRYTNLHLFEITQMLDARPKKKDESKKKSSHLSAVAKAS